MATVTTYVDTDVAAGGIGTIGDPYSSMSEWNTQEATNLVTDGDLHVVNLVGTAADTTGNFSIISWTTGISNFITINGNNNTGAYSTSHYRLEYTTTGAYQDCVRIWEDYTVFNDVQFKITTANSSSSGLYVRASKVDVNRCIARGVLSGSIHSAKGFYDAAGTPGNYHSCLAFDFDLGTSARGFYLKSTTAAHYLRNCTAHNCIEAFTVEGGYTIAENCLSQSSSGGFGNYNWDFTSSRYNCSEISTADAPGGNSQTGTVTFVDAAGGNFQLTAMDKVAKGNGVDLSAAFNFDLAGNTMPATWPIGCLQAVDGIVFDSSTDLANGDSYTADAGSDRIVLVALSSNGGNPPNPPTSMTLGGNALTLIVYEVDNVGATGKWHKAFYYIKEADLLAGSQTLQWSWTSAPSNHDRAIVFTISGVDQTTSIGDFASDSEDANTSIASSALNVANGDMVMAFCGVTAGATTISDPAGYTNVYNNASNFGYKDHSLVYKTLAGTGTESPEFTLSSSSGGVAVFAVIKKATAGGGGGGTTYALTPVNVASASEVSTPTLSQVFNLTPTSVESTSEVSTPALEQVFNLVPTPVESTSEINNTTLEQLFNLVPVSIESSTEVTKPVLTLVGSQSLTPVSAESNTEVSNPSLEQVFNLTPILLQSNTEVSTPEITQSFNLIPTLIEASTEVSTSTLAQVFSLIPSLIEANTEASTPTLAQIFNLTPVSVESLSAVNAPTLNESSDISNASIVALQLQITTLTTLVNNMQADLIIINNNVKKASLLIPARANLN